MDKINWSLRICSMLYRGIGIKAGWNNLVGLIFMENVVKHDIINRNKNILLCYRDGG